MKAAVVLPKCFWRSYHFFIWWYVLAGSGVLWVPTVGLVLLADSQYSRLKWSSADCCLCFSVQLAAFLVFLAFFCRFIAEIMCFLKQIIIPCSATSVSCCFMSPMKSFQTDTDLSRNKHTSAVNCKSPHFMGADVDPRKVLVLQSPECWGAHGRWLHCATTDGVLHLAGILSNFDGGSILMKWLLK